MAQERLESGWAVGHEWLGDLLLNVNFAWVSSRRDVQLFRKEKALSVAAGFVHLQGFRRFVQFVDKDGEFKEKELVSSVDEKWSFREGDDDWEEILARRQ